jgi:DinB superfamily
MNPYAIYLSDRNPQDVVRETPARLTAYVEHLGAEGVERSLAPGKWTVRQILCHLADCEVAFGFRLRQALGERDHVIQPFDQDAWAKPYVSTSLDAHLALEAFSGARRWNVALLDIMSAEQLSQTLSHPERGQMTIQTVIETMGGHDLNHLSQIDRIANQRAAS